jgi:uncharacterized protein (TIGR02246 family)
VSSENIGLVQRVIEALNAGDDSAVDVFFAEDAELWPSPGAVEGSRPLRGHDQIRSWFEMLRQGWKQGTMVVVVREIEEAGDQVLASFTWRAIGDASGIEVSSEWFSVSRYPWRPDRASAVLH